MTMTYDQAKKILDQVKDGVEHPILVVCEALAIVEGLRNNTQFRGEGVDSEEEKKDWRGWVRSRAILVGNSKS